MQPDEHHLQFTFNARYYQLGNITQRTRQVWFVLHGYGQLARFFIPKFEILVNHEVCVIAPEGLSRFYLEELEKRAVTGNTRVGATWMTAENRLMDIDNYLTYLDSVYKKVMKSAGKNVTVTILGFSQGAATASRWALHQPEAFHKLILWAGIFPADMDFSLAHQIFSGKRVDLVYGTNDPFLTEKREREMKALVQKVNIEPNILRFEGGHEIHAPLLLQLI